MQVEIQDKAKELWVDPNSLTLWHARGTATYNSCLLALFLMNSLSPEFAALLHSHINSKYSTNGPTITILFTMCIHIHCVI